LQHLLRIGNILLILYLIIILYIIPYLNNSLTDGLIKTIIVKIPKTVPKGAKRQLIDATIRQKKYFLLWAKNLAAENTQIEKIQPKITKNKPKIVNTQHTKAGVWLPRESTIFSGETKQKTPKII